jgi:anti-anti-sigma regulatory factor
MLEQLNLVTGESEASLAHAMVVRVVEVRKASPGFSVDVQCPASYRQTLSIDWACDVLVEAALPSCKTLDDTVSLKQSISIGRKSELSDNVAATLESKVHDRETALIDVLVEMETTDVLDLCGLGTLVTARDRFKSVQVEGMVMATHPGLTPEEVQTAMKEFYASLYSPPLPSFESTIKDPTLRKLARNKIASNVCSAYAALYEAMSQVDKGGYEDLSFLGHTPEQVKTMFTV